MKKLIATIGTITTLGAGALAPDALVLREDKLDKAFKVANENVKVKQIDNVVEAELPWRGERGLKVKYDLGKPGLSEKLKDKRNKEVVTEVVDFDNGGFKIDIILNKKPKENVFCYHIEGWEDYNFYKQPDLTEREIVGSYAVYHKTLKNNEYKTGKAFHIPFPYVWEVGKEDEKVRADDLTFENGNLCVEVDKKYLAKAAYPVRVDPTFGYTGIGASNFSAYFYDNFCSMGSLSNRYHGRLATSTSSGTLSKITAYIGESGCSGTSDLNIKGVVYSKDSNGSDSHDLVASSDSTSVAESSNWRDFSLTGSITSGTEYIIGVLPQNTDNGDSSGGAAWSVKGDYTEEASDIYYTTTDLNTFTPPDPLNRASGSGYRLSIYATYTESAPAYTIKLPGVNTTSNINKINGVDIENINKFNNKAIK